MEGRNKTEKALTTEKSKNSLRDRQAIESGFVEEFKRKLCNPDFGDIPYPVLEYGHPSLEGRTSALSSDEVRQMFAIWGGAGLIHGPFWKVRSRVLLRLQGWIYSSSGSQAG